MYYWREGDFEVDFILKKKSKTIALEVKSGRAGKLSGLESFKTLHKPDKTYLVGTSGILWQEFLAMDPSELF